MTKPGIYYRFQYIFAIGFLVLFLTAPLAAQVNQAEMDNLGTVEFINYVGPYTRIDTLAQIRAIGFNLGQTIRAGNAESGDLRRYFIINSISPPDGTKLDADIVGLGVDTAVDHIRNLRLIIQGYLESAYQYTPNDAALLAEFITVYNAVYRGDWDFFVSRYKNPVIDNLTAERAGLSIRYDEWPGQTLMLVPMGTGLGGPLSAIDTAAISDQRVIEQLRQEPDMSIDQRRDLVNLIEREADEAGQQAAIARETIQQEEARIAQERQIAEQQQEAARQQQEQIAQEREQPGADLAALDQQALEAAQQEQEAQERQEELDGQQQTLDEQRDLAERQEAFAEQRTEEAQQQRQQIAQDQQTLIDQEPPAVAAGGILGASILTPISSLGRIVFVDPNTGMETRRSPLTSVDVRTITQIDNRLLAIAGEARGSAAIRLVEINASTLEMVKQGDDDIAQGSLIWVNGQDIYAITSTDGNLYMARFNNDLVLQARSSAAVHPFASLLFAGELIVTQRDNGSALLLNARDLTERR